MMAYSIGLTGSIGMGKSTTANLFAAEGVPTWDADAVVHRLYATGGAAVAPLRAIVPNAIRDNAVDRELLRQAVLADPSLLKQIEVAVHPLVAADRANFLATAKAPIVLFDIPLLFETGQAGLYESVVVADRKSVV